MFSRTVSTIALASLCVLGACTPEVAEWTPAEKPHENKVERVMESQPMTFKAHSEVMTLDHKKQLKAFLNANVPSAPSANVTLVHGSGEMLSMADLTKELRKFGFEESQISHVTDESKAPGAIDVVIERYVAIPPRCGDWNQSMGNAKQAQITGELGCSKAANLGMMIANPKDLIEGRPTGEYDGANQALRVKYYRTDNVKQLLDSPTTDTASASGDSGGSGAGISSGGN